MSPCAICSRPIPPHSHYVVKIEVYADPEMPPVNTDDLQKADFDKELADLLEQMKHLSADDLQDQVHRHFEFTICRPCQIRFLANPLGKPRTSQRSSN